MLQNNLYVLRLAASLFLLLLLFFVRGGNAGSPCLPREDIHPCTCTTIGVNKTTGFTVVTCSHVQSAKDLLMASINFRRMDIDRFIIIDSFLQAPKLYGNDAAAHQTLPRDWLLRLKIRELQIVDSAVASCFMCDSSSKCSNRHQTHMKVVNSSATNTICTICKAANDARFSWTGCMSRLKNFKFTGNELSAVEKDLFPELMTELTELSLCCNKITRVVKDAFKNIPKLSSVDLSHNLIKDLPGDIFGDNPNPNLKSIDLSWNQIATVSSSLLRLSPSLATLNFGNNLIGKLEQQAWKPLSKNIKTIDLTDNPLCCDCDLKWLNTFLPTHTAVLGKCAQPTRFEMSKLRKASKLLNTACGHDVKKLSIKPCPAA